MNEQTFHGTPRPLPRALFCHVPAHWCGRRWFVNTAEQYNAAIEERVNHEQLCSGARGIA